MKVRMLLLIAAGGLLAAETPKDEASRKDLEKMQGDWQATKMVLDGFVIPDDDAQSLFRTVKGDQYTVFKFEKMRGKGTFRLDATKTPKTIDAQPDGPPGKAPPLMLGIYEIDGNTLKMCFSAPGKERPKDLEAKEGSGNTLTVWTREKK
jgi:uncharacterized protein (TIGR03067 family)